MVARLNRKPSPEQIEGWRREIEEEGKTLREIGKREGYSGEWIRQMVGKVDRPSRQQKKQAEVKRLFEAGKTDQEIAEQVRLSVASVKVYRGKLGLKRPSRRKWDNPSIITFAQAWYERFGYLAAIDWNPSQAIACGQTERARRFYELGAPFVNTVRHYFGSWSEMKRQAGIPESPLGYPNMGRFKGHATKKGGS